MPYRKRPAARRPKRRFTRKSGLSSQVARLSRKMRMMGKPELKAFDFTIGPTTMTSSGSVSSMWNMTQGIGEAQVIGYNATLRYLQVRMTITVNATPNVNVLRMLIFRDKQCNGSTPSVSDVLDVGTGLYLANMNLHNRRRFRVLVDKQLVVSTVQAPILFLKWNKKLKATSVYSAGGATPETQGLFVMFVADQVTNGPSVIFQSRVKYTDD